jgi:penicillin-binding protein 1A
VAKRPVEQFDTQVPVPDWQLTPEEEMLGDSTMDANLAQPMMVDENGMPIGVPPTDPNYPQQQPMVRPDGTGEPTQQELDQAFPPNQQPRQPQTYPPRQPGPNPPPRQPPQSTPPDPLQPRPDAA